MTDDRVSWVSDDSALETRLNELWPGWSEENDSNLAAHLDSTPGWDGWAAWSTQDKLTQLWQLLDVWYPPETNEPAAPVDQPVAPADRIAWIWADSALTMRLDAVWPGWAEADGLAATLDRTEQWNGWDTWETSAKLDYLRVTLDAWYPPDTNAGVVAADEPVAGLENHVSAILTQILQTVPGAADLSEAELSRILTSVLAKHGVPVSS